MLCELKKVTKTYGNITPINNLDFSIGQRDFISISGESGAGKSTLLFLIGGMLTPTAGEIYFNGQAYNSMDDNQISRLRSVNIGYISQSIQLLQALTVRENINFAKKVARRHGADANLPDTDYIIDYLGLNEKQDFLPCYLSGGQKRRAMIAVTWARNPRIFLLDEPTNDLDDYWAKRVMELFENLNDAGKSIVLVTHNQKYMSISKKHFELIDGKLV